MNPQERQLVAELFDRLASLEPEPRDPDAERVIAEGFRRAPHGGYALVRRLSDPKGLLLDFLSRRFRARAAALGIRTNPGFAGTYDYGARMPIAELFPQFLDGMPDGGVVMCHPGRIDDELERLDPLTDLREQEYVYLAGDDFAALLAQQGVTLA